MSDENVVIEFRSKKYCIHNRLLVDDSLEKIECKDCGERLNPFFAIRQLMKLSSTWENQIARLQLEREQAEKKTRTKCEHCKKMTRVRTEIKEFQIIDRMRKNGVKI